MRILLIEETNWDLRGPHQQHHLMERLSSLGHEIRIIDYNFLWESDKIEGIFSKKFIFKNKPKVIPSSNSINIIRPSMIRIPILNYISIPIFHSKVILEEIIKFKPEIIIGFSLLNNTIALLFSKIFKIPFIYYINDHLHTLVPLDFMKFFAKALEEFNIRNATEICVINKGLMDYVIELGGSKKKIHIFPGGVDLIKYNDNSKRDILRKTFGITENTTVLFFMGWMYTFSGLKELSDYIVEKEDNIPNITLLIVGTGDLFDYISKSKTKLKNKNKIILTGQVEFKEIASYLQIADICLLPAYNNDTMNNIVPIKLYEYLGAGKPVICTKLKGVFKEFGENNGMIYIHKPIDVFNKIPLILKNYEIISKSALKFVSNYDWSVIIQNFERFILNVIKNR